MDALIAKRIFFDEKAAGWDLDWSPENEQRLQSIFSRKIPAFSHPVLDLGCGTGVLLPHLKQFGKGSGVIVETDISAQMMQSAALRCRTLDSGVCVQSDGHMLPFREDAFETVFCFQVFPHFHDKLSVIRECHRVLNAGGRLIILHLMGHRELNDMHRQAGRIVENDRIIPAEDLAGHLQHQGFRIETVRESSRLYLISALK